MGLTPKDRIIFALDFTSFEEAEPYVSCLKDHVGLFKVGRMLLFAEGIRVVERIQAMAGDARIFLDYKFRYRGEDIPLQLEQMAAILEAKSRPVGFLTVHTDEGGEAVRAMVRQFRGVSRVLGVTVLTSEAAGARVEEQVVRRAETAHEAGCDGVVCSGLEAMAVRKAFGPDFTIVTPGVRPVWSRVPGDDQRRTVTAGEAIRNGVDFVVIGRPIRLAPDPVEAARRIAEEIAAALPG